MRSRQSLRGGRALRPMLFAPYTYMYRAVGNKMMKGAQKDMNVDDVADLMDEMQDAQDDMAEINDGPPGTCPYAMASQPVRTTLCLAALSQPMGFGADMDDADLEAELEGMEAEMLDEQLAAMDRCGCSPLSASASHFRSASASAACLATNWAVDVTALLRRVTAHKRSQTPVSRQFRSRRLRLPWAAGTLRHAVVAVAAGMRRRSSRR